MSSLRKVFSSSALLPKISHPGMNDKQPEEKEEFE